VLITKDIDRLVACCDSSRFSGACATARWCSRWESRRYRFGNWLFRTWELEKRSLSRNFLDIYSRERGRSGGRASYCFRLTKYWLHSNVKDGNRCNFDESTFRWRGRAKVTSMFTCMSQWKRGMGCASFRIYVHRKIHRNYAALSF